MPHPEQPDTAFDEHRDAPIPEPHTEPAEANDTLTSAGRAQNRISAEPGSGTRVSRDELEDDSQD
jgi:hypothetical protein